MKSVYILHEGNAKDTHDNKLIKLLIEDLKKQYPNMKTEEIEFHGMGTKSNFFKAESYPPLLIKGVETQQIEKVLFIVDADDVNNDQVYGGFENTQKALDGIIEQLNFQNVSSTYIMCDPETKTGYLESLILSTIPKKQRHCIDCFLKCWEFEPEKGDKSIYDRVYRNLAHPFHPYRLDHLNFDTLKTELKNLFTGI